jgi:hypothetical protein
VREVRFVIENNNNGSALDIGTVGGFVDRNPLANITLLGLAVAPRVVRFAETVVPAANITFNATTMALKVVGLEGFTASGA